MSRKFTTQRFVENSVKKHGNTYDYTKSVYKSAHAKLTITCPTHGDFSIRPNDHLTGQGCRQCGIERRNTHQTYTTQSFVDRANVVHKQKYCYDLVKYTKSNEPVDIVCFKHGTFQQRPGRHLFGDGCPDCAREAACFDGYTVEYFNRYPHERTTPARLYVVRFSNETETFYKVGITKTSIKKRFHWGYADYSIEVFIQTEMPLYEAFLTEQKILTTLKTQRYIPHIKIGGWTECLSAYLTKQDFETWINTSIRV